MTVDQRMQQLVLENTRLKDENNKLRKELLVEEGRDNSWQQMYESSVQNWQEQKTRLCEIALLREMKLREYMTPEELMAWKKHNHDLYIIGL